MYIVVATAIAHRVHDGSVLPGGDMNEQVEVQMGWGTPGVGVVDLLFNPSRLDDSVQISVPLIGLRQPTDGVHMDATGSYLMGHSRWFCHPALQAVRTSFSIDVATVQMFMAALDAALVANFIPTQHTSWVDEFIEQARRTA